jgi:DNA-binding MarR family transcriptional regulator
VKKVKNGDNKKFVIMITEKGITKYWKVSRNSLKILFDDLTPEEKLQLRSKLNKVLNTGRNLLCLDSKLPFLTGNSETK